MTDAALRLAEVVVRLGATAALDRVSWEVRDGERWVVLGPNGCGKTTLLRLATGYLHPTSGTVEVLGHRLGRVDVRTLRRRIGLVSAAVARMLRPEIAVFDAVLAGRDGALETWWHGYDETDRERARTLLAASGLDRAATRAFGTLSEGERQQVLLARALMTEPALVLLDEPAAGLDLAARESLVARLEALAIDVTTPPVVFVTHHVEEIPPSFTSVLLLRAGRVVASGPMEATLTAEAVSSTFGLPLVLRRDGGRFSARAVAG